MRAQRLPPPPIICLEFRASAEIKRASADWLAERIEGASGVRIGELRAH